LTLSILIRARLQYNVTRFMSSNDLRRRKEQASNFILYTIKEVLEKLYTQTTLEEIGNTV
jgi:hypothetical protein